MDANQFDRIAKLFAAHRLSRRAAMRQGGAGLAAAGLAAAGLAPRPPRTPPQPAGARARTTRPSSSSSPSSPARIAPKDGRSGTYTLTLEHGLGQTLYFSDRPERIVGAAPTAEFLAGLGFPPDNPPNAALVVETAPGRDRHRRGGAVNPAYDEATHTATYEAKVLADWRSWG